MPNEILTQAQIDAAIKQLDGWAVCIDAGQPALEKTYILRILCRLWVYESGRFGGRTC